MRPPVSSCLQDYFGYLGSVEIPHEFLDGFTVSEERFIEISVGIALNPQMALGPTDIFTA